MSEYIDIERIEQRGNVVKTADGFTLPLTYVLVDGQRIDTARTSTRKREAVAFAATLPAAPSRPTSACFRDGKFSGTRTSFYIGPRP